MLIGSVPKRESGEVRGVPIAPPWTPGPPAYRERLTHPITQDEHGKPVVLLGE